MSDTETWLRVVIYKSTGDEAAGAEYLKSSTKETLRLLEKQRGFKLGYWGHNPIAGEMAAVTYWDSLDAIREAGSVLTSLQAEREQHGITVSSSRNVRLFALPVGPMWENPPGS